MDKEKVLYWYYTVKDTFTPDHIKNDQDLKEKFVSIEIYLLKNYGKIDDLSLSDAVELKLKVPKKHYGIDYKAFIAKLDTNLFKSRYLFKRQNDRIIKKYFDYRIKRNLKGVQIKLILLLGKLMELKGSKIEFFFPNEKWIGEFYRICIDGERKGSREAKKDREAIDELINTVKPDFDEKLLELIEEIESKKHKDKTETKPSAPKPRKVPEKEFFDLFDRLQKDKYKKTEKDRELLEHTSFKITRSNYLRKRGLVEEFPSAFAELLKQGTLTYDEFYKITNTPSTVFKNWLRNSFSWNCTNPKGQFNEQIHNKKLEFIAKGQTRTDTGMKLCFHLRKKNIK